MDRLKILVFCFSIIQLLGVVSIEAQAPCNDQVIAITDQKSGLETAAIQFQLTKDKVKELELFLKACDTIDALEKIFNEEQVITPTLCIYRNIITDLKLRTLCRTVTYLKTHFKERSSLQMIELGLKNNKFGQVGKKCLILFGKQKKMLSDVWLTSDDIDVIKDTAYKQKVSQELVRADKSKDDPLAKLNIAIFAHNTKEVKRLLEQEAVPIDDEEIEGHRPLTHALLFGFSDIIKLLIESKADLTFASDMRGYVPLLFVNKGLGNESDIVRVRSLLKDASIECEDKDQMTPLMRAAARADMPLLSALLSLNAQVNVPNSEGSTALMVASALGRVNAVQLLLANKADWKMYNNGFCTAFNLTSNPQIKELLKKRGAENYEHEVKKRANAYFYQQKLKNNILALSKTMVVPVKKSVDHPQKFEYGIYAIGSDEAAAQRFIEEHSSFVQESDEKRKSRARNRQQNQLLTQARLRYQEIEKQKSFNVQEQAVATTQASTQTAADGTFPAESEIATQQRADTLKKEQEESQKRAREKLKQERLVAKKIEKKERREKGRLLEEQMIAQQKIDREREQSLNQKRLDAQKRLLEDKALALRLAQENEQQKKVEAQRVLQEQQLQESIARQTYEHHIARPDIYMDDVNGTPLNFSNWLNDHKLYYGSICQLCHLPTRSKAETDKQAKIKEQLQRRRSAISAPIQIFKLEQFMPKQGAKIPDRRSAFSVVNPVISKQSTIKAAFAAQLQLLHKSIGYTGQ